MTKSEKEKLRGIEAAFAEAMSLLESGRPGKALPHFEMVSRSLKAISGQRTGRQ